MATPMDGNLRGGLINCVGHGQSLFFMLELAPPELSSVSISFAQAISSESVKENILISSNRTPSPTFINWKQTFLNPLFGEKINFYTIKKGFRSLNAEKLGSLDQRSSKLPVVTL